MRIIPSELLPFFFCFGHQITYLAILYRFRALYVPKKKTKTKTTRTKIGCEDKISVGVGIITVSIYFSYVLGSCRLCIALYSPGINVWTQQAANLLKANTLIWGVELCLPRGCLYVSMARHVYTYVYTHVYPSESSRQSLSAVFMLLPATWEIWGILPGWNFAGIKLAILYPLICFIGLQNHYITIHITHRF